MRTEKVTWGGLKAVIVDNLPPGEKPKLVVVLCHGFGAPASDLVALGQMLVTQSAELSHAAFVFPAAPLALDTHGIPGGCAWWMIDLDGLLNRPTPELLHSFRHDSPEGLPEARDKLNALLDQAANHFNLSLDRFVLGGFSQGSMLATDVALRMSSGPAGLCILSGALVNEAEWSGLAANRGPMTVFQSHGRYDSILPYSQATALRDVLTTAGHAVEFVPFDGDHEIPPAVLSRLASRLERLIQ